MIARSTSMHWHPQKSFQFPTPFWRTKRSPLHRTLTMHTPCWVIVDPNRNPLLSSMTTKPTSSSTRKSIVMLLDAGTSRNLSTQRTKDLSTLTVMLSFSPMTWRWTPTEDFMFCPIECRCLSMAASSPNTTIASWLERPMKLFQEHHARIIRKMLALVSKVQSTVLFHFWK